MRRYYASCRKPASHPCAHFDVVPRKYEDGYDQICRAPDGHSCKYMNSLRKFADWQEKDSAHNWRVCSVCGRWIDPEKNQEALRRLHQSVLDQADHFGVGSLTEHKQVLYEGMCHAECYDQLQ
jgi:hypothetical protein